MQLPLLGLEDFDPLPQRSGHYVATLQNKSGELRALQEASQETWGRLTPLLRILGPKNQQKQLKASTVGNWMKRAADALGGHPFFLDTVRLRPTRPTTPDGDVVLSRIYHEARKRGLCFVPVVPVEGRSEVHTKVARDAFLEGGRGIALRYKAFGSVSIATPEQVLSNALGELQASACDTDLIIDLEWLSTDLEIESEDIVMLVDHLAQAGEWRNIILMGTTIPSALSCIPEGTIGFLPRREWKIWEGVRNELAHVPVSFGDYAIQHPKPPLEGDGGPGMRANIRYTVADSTLIARGRGAVIQEGKGQYRQLCQQLCARAEYKGSAYSWGDSYISDCANWVADPGSQDLWRAVGTSHHLRFVTDQLSQLSA